MERYQIILEGETPLLMHRDNIQFSERVRAWQQENRSLSVAGDDRTPAWSWIGSLYDDGKYVGLNADNMMTMLREGGAKVPTGAKNETYKRQTQSGIVLEEICPPLLVNGKRLEMAPILALLDEDDFAAHAEAVQEMGFDLLVKRAKVGTSKHIRVSPMFEKWAVITTLMVVDPKEYGIVINGEDRPGDISSPFSLSAIELPNTETECRAVYSLVDINGHLNNTHYLDMALDLIGFDELRTISFKTVKCVFKKEIPAGTKFDLSWGKVGDTYHFRNEYFALDLSMI